MLIEALGGGWVAFSPLTGGSHLLNDESVAILDALGDGPSIAEDRLVDDLAAGFGVPRSQVAQATAGAWSSLEAAGLIRTRARLRA